MLEFLVGILVGMFIWDYWCERDHWYREDLNEFIEEEEKDNEKHRRKGPRGRMV